MSSELNVYLSSFHLEYLPEDNVGYDKLLEKSELLDSGKHWQDYDKNNSQFLSYYPFLSSFLNE